MFNNPAFAFVYFDAGFGALVGSISGRLVKKCKIGPLVIGTAVYAAIFLNTDLTDRTDKNGSEFLGQIRFYPFHPLNPCSKKHPPNRFTELH